MHKRLLSFDEFTGVRTEHHVDPYTGKGSIVSTQDVEPTLDFNKAKQSDGSNGWVDKEKIFRHAATIPASVWGKWLLEEGIDIFNKDHMPAVMRKLDSNEFVHLRTATFRLGNHKGGQ